jgi:hypothetical protein
MNAPQFVILERSEESMGWITPWGDGPPVDSSAALRMTMLFDDVRVFISSHHAPRSDALGSQNDNVFGMMWGVHSGHHPSRANA